MNSTNESPAPGCWIDSHHGHYAIPGVIYLAEGFGRKLDNAMAKLLGEYADHYFEDDYPWELIVEESDASAQWLNDHHRPDGFWWEWNDGDFGLYAEDDLID